MDINHILSLLQEANQTPAEHPTSVAIPSVLDLSSIDQDVIQQVRQEYQAQHAKPSTDSLDSLLDSIRAETTITPDVLVALGRMVKETDLLQVLRDMKCMQDRKEQELFDYRQEIQKRQAKQKDAVCAKALIGANGPGAVAEFDKTSAAELKKLDTYILHQMDKEYRNQQETLMKLKVPFFKMTSDPSEMKLQQKVISILHDMVK
ncbi:hypothetical protein DFQ28_009581 [Apophysomyces sp. BC1034]|nr:hypothetical protein DFQ30_009277 [Apophysomyces sp. BC1015]KAG0172698.1 hypothetical protein DFQ29_008276 [Apophysomyces sp. BC1021]KAG0185288.1 hypothetical protein DFQ28_009581 [Apophysomyces sp. BC1034]